MARCKHYDHGQSKLIPVDFDRQVLPGTFEYTLSYLIEHECDQARDRATCTQIWSVLSGRGGMAAAEARSHADKNVCARVATPSPTA